MELKTVRYAPLTQPNFALYLILIPKSDDMKKNYMLVVTSFLITIFLPYTQALGQQTSDRQTDPLIDKGGEVTIYIGAFLIIIAIAAIIGVLSRRIEHAVLTALGLSLIPIAIFFFTSH
ncbi:hypothetical protein NIES4106_57450 (plasmid) [Fischerella sp. NIES-4106]|nr:hypothetical protein NIES4106_57450 [Fischerella sp. NIES-4106]